MAGKSVRLTVAAADKIAPVPGKQVLVWDTEVRGFGLRISGGGAKSFIYQRRVNGTDRRVTIGRVGEISADAARRKAMALAAQFLDGKDPVVEKRRQRARSITLRDAFDDYISAPKKKGGGKGSAKKARTVADIEKVATAYFGDWLDMPASDITGAMCKKRHAEIVARSAAQANLAFRYLRAVFNHLMADTDDEDDPIIRRNPVERLNKLAQWAEVKRATGHVPDDRLAAFIEAAHTELLPMNNGADVRDAILFMLLTGARIGEVLGDPSVGYPALSWADVDLARKMVTLRDTKNRSDHELPLGNALAGMLKARQGGGEYGGQPARPGSGFRNREIDQRFAGPTVVRVGAAHERQVVPHLERVNDVPSGLLAPGVT